MQEGQLLMTQADRDRLVTLKKARNLITQREAAEELRLSIRQVKRLLYGSKKRGDGAVAPGLSGKPSSRRMEESTQKGAVKIFVGAGVPRVRAGFGRVFASSTNHPATSPAGVTGSSTARAKPHSLPAAGTA